MNNFGFLISVFFECFEIIIDDISPLREITADILSKKIHFITTKPAVLSDESGFAGSFGAETQFVGQNASTSPKI